MEWRPVVGFEDWYEISERGDVRRMRAEKGHNRTYKGRPLRQHPSRKGYMRVTLSRDGCYFTGQVHVLVAAAFIGPRPKGLQVNHIDTNKQNNHYSNLEYKTCLENIQHAVLNGLRAPKHGALNGCAKVTEEDVRAIRAAYVSGATQPELARRYGLTQANVSYIILRRTWAHVQ